MMNYIRTTGILAVALCAVVAFAAGGSSPTASKIIPPAAGKSAWRQTVTAAKTKSPTIKPMGQLAAQPAMSLHKTLSLNYASNCTVYVDRPVNALYDWLIGDEIYYAYQDLLFPKVTCDTTYPFVVTHIGMTLALNDVGTVQVQVFLATVDPIYSSPVCPVPGELIYLSEQYAVSIPAPDVYSIIIALEKPVPVYEPYFACIYYGNDISAMYPGIAIDTVPYLCINYNDWGEGLTDLAQNGYYNFPGSIHLFSIGYSKTGMLPKPHLIIPGDSGVILSGGQLWAAELNDTIAYESARLDYFKSGSWYQIGADFDGAVPLRNGVSPATNSDGWSTIWRPYGLPEGNYLLRVSIADFDSTYVSDTITAYLDLKPLEPVFSGRTDHMTTCGAETVAVTIPDENPIAVTFGYRNLSSFEDRSLQLLKRNDFGDANGNAADGNHNYNGEFGEYYVAPAVFGSFFKYWYDKGYIEIMSDGSTFLTVPQMVEKLAALFATRADTGTEDDNLVYGLSNWLKTHTSRIVPEFKRKPSWEWFKANYMGRLATVAFTIRSPFGTWLAVQKVDYQNAKVDSFPVTYYDPIGGLLRESFLLVRGDSLLLGYLPNNTKYPIDVGVALHTKLETITYLTFGTDFDGIDGFKSTLPAAQLQQNLLYLVRARALDANNQIGDGYWLMKYDCSATFRRGDADNDGLVTVSDVTYLVNFVFGSGPAPKPTLSVGDADCNGFVDISDAVYLINYVFGAGPAPCP